MNDDLLDRVMIIVNRIRGTGEDIIHTFENAVDEGEIMPEEWRQNESAILEWTENEIFTCVRCGWTLNVDEMGEDVDGEQICKDCE